MQYWETHSAESSNEIVVWASEILVERMELWLTGERNSVDLFGWRKNWFVLKWQVFGCQEFNWSDGMGVSQFWEVRIGRERERERGEILNIARIASDIIHVGASNEFWLYVHRVCMLFTWSARRRGNYIDEVHEKIRDGSNNVSLAVQRPFAPCALR